MEKTFSKDNEILKALKSVENENTNLYNCLFEVTETRRALEATLDAVENKVYEIGQETEQLQSINAINFYKVQNVEREASDLEQKQKFFTDTIKSLERKIKEYKENSEIKINNFVREADKLSELFLSAVNKENAESECAKIFDDIRTLKSEIEEKEEALFRVKKELEEFVFYGMPENPVEASVSLGERESVMNILEDQLITVRKMHQNLKSKRREKETAEYEWARTHHMAL